MQKIKCIKCGLRFKDRSDETDGVYRSQCCMVCSNIIKMVEISLQAFGRGSEFHGPRKIMLEWDHLKIERIKK